MNRQETEARILATIWAYPTTFTRVEQTGLKEEHFATEGYGPLWAAMSRCGAIDPETGGLDTVALYDALTGQGRAFWKKPEGITLHLGNLDYNREAAVYGAREIVEQVKREKLYQSLSLSLRTLTAGGAVTDVLATLDLAIADQKGEIVGAPQTYSEMLQDLFDSMMHEDEPIKCKVGLPLLDTHLSGFFGGELFVIGARPGIGKTSILTQLLTESAKAGTPSIFFTGEMLKRQIIAKVLSQESGVWNDRIRLPQRLTERDSDKLMAARDTLARLPVVTTEIKGRPIEELCSTARRLVREHGARIIAFDYLQLIDGSIRSNRLSRYQEISEVSRQLKLLAQETKTIVIALAQLNREGDKATDKRPQVSHLKESGQIEQDADLIVLMSRPDLTNTDTLFHIAKNRHGSLAEYLLTFEGAATRYTAAREYEAPIKESRKGGLFD